jgi:hypothetical protein
MESINVLLEPVRALLIQVGGFMPRLLVALLIVLAGWLLAKAVRMAIMRGLRAVNVHVVTERAGIDGLLRQSGVGVDAIGALGALAFWFGMVVALIIATGTLGLDQASELIGRLALFLLRLFVALIVIAIGAYFARVVADVVRTRCERERIGDAAVLARLVYTAVIVFVTLIAIDALDIGGQFVHYAFLIVLAGVVLTLALAFGLAGRDWAAQVLDRWWPRQPRRDS